MSIKELREKQNQALENEDYTTEDALRDEIIAEYEKIINKISKIVSHDCVPCCSMVKQIEKLINEEM